MSKLKTLGDVRWHLNIIPTLNWGGCGIAAYAMYKWLKKNDKLSPDFKFVLCYRWGQDDIYANNSQVLKTKEGDAVACNHIGIWNGYQAIDSEEVMALNTYRYVQYVDAEWFMVTRL